jgi:hypothetical protein
MPMISAWYPHSVHCLSSLSFFAMLAAAALSLPSFCPDHPC